MSERKGTRDLLRRIDINAPAILTLTALSGLMLILHAVLGTRAMRMFAAYYTSFADPWMYARLLTHALMHQDLSHFTGNFLMILAVGPMVEEKYGTRRLAGMMAITAVATGLTHVLTNHGAMLVGASGIVFMLILLASFANFHEGKVPLTVILVAALYIGNEIVAAVTQIDAISHLSHIVGGLCGAAFGFRFRGGKG